jgi:hypothetical protein
MPVSRQKNTKPLTTTDRVMQALLGLILFSCFMSLSWITLKQGHITLHGRSGPLFIDGLHARVYAAVFYAFSFYGFFMLMNAMRAWRGLALAGVVIISAIFALALKFT